jgi:D-beta-D-heptose 7-phosphate kinase/D-beta-D-heptose 1-phosphate adenosyltransferase
MQSISTLLEHNRQRRVKILVVGDCMLDEYYEVKVTRISPESPNISVMLSDADEPTAVRPGGAANVCYQLKHFNCQCDLLGFVDEEALARFSQSGLNAGHCIKLPSSRIPRKKRFFDGDTQVGGRWDIESFNYGLHPDILEIKRSELMRELTAIGDQYDAVIFSDYAKGVFSPTQVLPSLKVPMIVDPKKGPLEMWCGCTVVKPNEREAAELTGKADIMDQALAIRVATGCTDVVVTRGGKGLYISHGSEHRFYTPPIKVQANSTIGAGDSFISILALCLAHNIDILNAAEVAFEAGTAYVQQKHNQPVTPWELQKQSKFVTPAELKNRNFNLVWTNGCFDVMHSGHLDTLKFAREQGDKLVVAVNTDASIARLKGPNRPVVCLAERMRMLAALECVDFVLSFDEDTPLKLIEEVRPDVVVKGGDYKPESVVGSELTKVVIAPFVEDHSTTNIIEKIKALT